MRELYAARQAALLRLARELLGPHLAIAPSSGGLHLVARLPDGVCDASVVSAARARGGEVTALSRYYAGAPDAAPQGLLLGHAGFDADTTHRTLVKLRRAIDQVVRATSPGTA